MLLACCEMQTEMLIHSFYLIKIILTLIFFPHGSLCRCDIYFKKTFKIYLYRCAANKFAVKDFIYLILTNEKEVKANVSDYVFN